MAGSGAAFKSEAAVYRVSGAPVAGLMMSNIVCCVRSSVMAGKTVQTTEGVQVRGKLPPSSEKKNTFSTELPSVPNQTNRSLGEPSASSINLSNSVVTVDGTPSSYVK